MPASTSASVRPASGTWKTYCGCPAAKPPSTACARQPELVAAGATTRAPPWLRSVGDEVAEAAYAGVGDAGLDGGGVPATGDDRRTHPDAEGAAGLEVGGHRAQPAARGRVVPVDHRALGQVGEVALEPAAAAGRAPGRRPPARRRGTSRATRGATRTSPGPRPGSAGSSRRAGGAGSRGARRRRSRVRRAGSGRSDGSRRANDRRSEVGLPPPHPVRARNASWSISASETYQDARTALLVGVNLIERQRGATGPMTRSGGAQAGDERPEHELRAPADRLGRGDRRLQPLGGGRAGGTRRPGRGDDSRALARGARLPALRRRRPRTSSRTPGSRSYAGARPSSTRSPSAAG